MSIENDIKGGIAFFLAFLAFIFALGLLMAIFRGMAVSAFFIALIFFACTFGALRLGGVNLRELLK